MDVAFGESVVEFFWLGMRGERISFCWYADCVFIRKSAALNLRAYNVTWGLGARAGLHGPYAHKKKFRSYRSKLTGGGGETYFERPDHCQKLNSWWNDTNFCHPVCQRILLGVWGITALNWLEYCSSVSVFLHKIYMTTLYGALLSQVIEWDGS